MNQEEKKFFDEVFEICKEVKIWGIIVSLHEMPENGACEPILGSIEFSTRLLSYPTELRKKTIYHELAHMRHHSLSVSHNEKFWEILKEMCPNYDELEEKWASFLPEKHILASKEEIAVTIENYINLGLTMKPFFER